MYTCKYTFVWQIYSYKDIHLFTPACLPIVHLGTQNVQKTHIYIINGIKKGVPRQQWCGTPFFMSFLC